MRRPARVGHVVRAAANAPVVPGVQQVEDERGVNRNRRVQTTRRLPRPIPNAGNELAVSSRRVERAPGGRYR